MLFNLLLGTRPMRAAASIVYFHRKGVFDPPEPAARDIGDAEMCEDGTSRSTRIDGK